MVKRLLHHKSYKVRLQAAIYLAKLRDPRTLRPLMQCVAKEPHYLVRAFCAAGLGRLGNRTAVPVLKRALKDSSAFVRRRAKKALEQIDIQSPPGNKRGYTLRHKPRAKVLVLVQRAKHRNRRVPRRVHQFLTKTLRAQLDANGLFEVARGGVQVPNSWIRKRRLPALKVEVQIVQVRRRRRGRQLSVFTQIKAIVTRHPSRAVALIAMTESRSIQNVKGRLRRSERETLYRYLERQAVDGAVQRFARRMRQINPS